MNVLIPTAFRAHTDGEGNVSIEAQTVREALDRLIERYPGLDAILLDESRKLVSFVSVFVNEKNIRDLSHESTPLDASDELLLVPAIAGG
ncbi:MAG: MoaD/ThiS family protein [Planctomycetota bacterium]